MKKYTIQTPVEGVSGYQYWTVLAESPEEAIEKFNTDGGEFEYEEIEVGSLGDPEVIE